jgi:hypothetical protein
MKLDVSNRLTAILRRRARGALNRVRYVLHRLYSRRGVVRNYEEFMRTEFDRRHGVETSEWVYLESLELSGPSASFANWYLPSEPSVLASMLRALAIDPQQYVFVDLGSGKGRMLIAASNAGFRRAIGVELSPRLSAQAAQNIERFRHSFPSPRIIETLCLDAVEFVFPGDPLVIFFFNSFTEPVLVRVLKNLERSLEERPRRVYLLQNGRRYFPEITRVLQQAPGLRLIESADDYAIYDAVVVPAASGDSAACGASRELTEPTR